MRALSNEKLFGIVKKYPMLYDPTHEDFKSTHKRDKLWYQIGREHGEHGEEVKKRWKSLRDTYVKHIRRCQTQPKTKKWIWADHMKFFLPYLNYNSKYGNAIDTESENGPDIECEDTMLDNVQHIGVGGSHEHFDITLPKEEYLLSASSFDDTSGNFKSIERNSPEAVQQSNTSAIFTITNGVAAVKRPHNNTDLQQEREDKQDHKRQMLEYDDNENILLAYAKTIKKFSPKRQAMTRFKIAQILMEQELLHIEESETGTRGNSADK